MEYRTQEIKDTINRFVNKDERVMAALQKLEEQKDQDAQERKEDKVTAKLSKTLYGPKGPFKVHFVAYDKRHKQNKPISEYGSEVDHWDMTSFHKHQPVLTQKDIETQVQIAKKKVRREIYLKFFNQSLAEHKKEYTDSSSSDESSSEEEVKMAAKQEPKRLNSKN